MLTLALKQAFQSTQPEWAATQSRHAKIFGSNFNPRSPSGLRLQAKKPSGMVLPISIHAARVGCDTSDCDWWPFIAISIHAARVGCDSKRLYHFCRRRLFQSTQPEWAATTPSEPNALSVLISIHAARVGCDQTVCTECSRKCHFNPRSPSGLRQVSAHS